MSPLIRLIQMVSSWLQALLAWLLGVRIDDFAPRAGWPGTIITIRGGGFSEARDQNDVRINGERALIIDAASGQLTVLAGEGTTTGLLTVTASSNSATTIEQFVVLPYPAAADAAAAGAPRFLHGPQSGTPQTNKNDQPILVLLAHVFDQSPDDPDKPRNILRDELISRCDQANRWWKEASFGRTSWKMSFSDWLALPQNDAFYFWRDGDADQARRDLFRHTSRPLAWAGSTIVNASILVEHPGTLIYNFKPGVSSGGVGVTANKLVGSRLYVGTATGGIFLHDISNLDAPILLGSVAIPGAFVTGLDLSGTRLYAALRDTGFAVIDVSNPSSPAVITQVNSGSDVNSLRVVGNDIWIGRQNHLQQYGPTGGAPAFLHSLDLGGWVTEIDGAGALLVVATDGDGVHVFDTSGGGPLPRSHSLAVLNVRGITLTGSLALLAAYEAGMIVLDLTDPTTPVQRGVLKTKKAACSTKVQGSEAILAVGGLDLLSIDISNPDAPKANGGETPSTMDPDMTALRNQLKAAILGTGLVKDKNALFAHALRAYFKSLPGGEFQANLGQYVGIILILKGPSLRGQSMPKETSVMFWPENIQFFDTKGLIYISHDAKIGRIAHEIGHWLGMEDIYQDKLDTGEIIPGTAEHFCLGGDHDNEPLFVGRHITETMKFFVGNPANVTERAWSPTAQLDCPAGRSL